MEEGIVMLDLVMCSVRLNQ